MGSTRNTLVIMARRPRWGCGKQRLAAALGQGVAWHFQRVALEALLRRLGGDPRWRLEVAVTPDSFARGSRRWTQGHPMVVQGDGDLGARMLHLLAGEHQQRGARLLVGSDIPDIEPSLIAKAFSLLKRHDWVLGPAVDGGFWAIGTRRRPWRPPDFGGIPWGSATVMAETSSRLRGSLALLPSLSDVDQADDLRQWLRHGPF